MKFTNSITLQWSGVNYETWCESMNLAYCDKIADVVRKALLKHDPDGIIGLIDPIKMTLIRMGIQFNKKDYRYVRYEHEKVSHNNRRNCLTKQFL